MSLKCKFCGQLGHDGTSDDGCIVFAKWILYQQASTRTSESYIKTNTRKFIQMTKRQQSSNRQRTQLSRQTKSLKELTQPIDANAIIHSLQLIHDSNENREDSSSDSDSEE